MKSLWRHSGGIAIVKPVFCFYHYTTVLMIDYLGVPDEERQRGIGTKLLKSILHQADREGLILYISFFTSKPWLRTWYESFGFDFSDPHRVIGERKPNVPKQETTGNGLDQFQAGLLSNLG